MQSIKHIIITRFLCNSKMNLGDKIFDKQFIKNGINLLKNFAFKSLSYQSNKNFEWVICIHKNTNKMYLKELYELQSDFKITILEVNNYINSYVLEYVKTFYNKYNYIITSWLDYDDEFYYNCIDEIQNSIQSNNSPIYVYTWQNSCMHYLNTNKFAFYKSVHPNNGGGIAIMLSLIQNTKCIMPLTIYSCGSHTNCSIYVKNNYEKIVGKPYDNETILMVDNNAIPKIVYTRHNDNDSNVHIERYMHSDNECIDFDYKKFYNI